MKSMRPGLALGFARYGRLAIAVGADLVNISGAVSPLTWFHMMVWTFKAIFSQAAWASTLPWATKSLELASSSPKARMICANKALTVAAVMAAPPLFTLGVENLPGKLDR